MANYTHLLVPVDFSEHSARAAARAEALAASQGARLTLLHAVDYLPPRYVAIELPEDIASPKSLAARARAHLDSWADERGLGGAERLVAVGAARFEIVRIAKERAVDLIVIGTSGDRTMSLLLGSTTSGVLHHAPCDVLSVQPDRG